MHVRILPITLKKSRSIPLRHLKGSGDVPSQFPAFLPKKTKKQQRAGKTKALGQVKCALTCIVMAWRNSTKQTRPPYSVPLRVGEVGSVGDVRGDRGTTAEDSVSTARPSWAAARCGSAQGLRAVPQRHQAGTPHHQPSSASSVHSLRGRRLGGGG